MRTRVHRGWEAGKVMLAAAVVVAVGGVPAVGLHAAPVPAGFPDTGGAGGAADAGGPAASEDPVTLPWELRDCTYLIALASADRAKVEEHLPAGFTAAGAPTTVGGTTVPSVVNVGFEVDVCAEGTGLSGPEPGMRYASFWVAVDPPGHLRVEGENSYFVNWDVLVPDAPRRDLLQGFGLPARDGAITLTRIAGPGGLTDAWDADWTLQGMGTFAAEGTNALVPSQSYDDSFVQFTEAGDGRLARWRTDYVSDTDSRRGAGTLHIDPDSWIASLFEAPEVPTLMLMGEWSYVNGEIVLMVGP